MNITQKALSVFLSVYLDKRVRRMRRGYRDFWHRLLRRPHVVSAFLQLDDPYSYLLAHYLPSLVIHYDIELRLHLSEARGEPYQPMPDMLAEYAVVDCERLARELGIPFLDKGPTPPVELRLAMLDDIAACHGSERFDGELLQALGAFWRGDAEVASRMTTRQEKQGHVDSVIAESRARQEKLGHYNSAMLHYNGEWYWGVDRLHYLLQRLDELGRAKQDSPNLKLAAIRQAPNVTLPVAPPTAARRLPTLEYFHSVRSPYSYLALGRVIEIADAFGLALHVRPVLPMVMRGLKVPRAKLRYIVSDAAREAERLGLAFGRIADPVGPGAERCMAVYRYAESINRGREFLQNAGDACWSQAVDLSTDKGMRRAIEKSGLAWADVVDAMTSDEWRADVEANRESMMSSGSWGVPTIRLGDYVVWGQDRDWLLVRHIEELCDTGDGILV